MLYRLAKSLLFRLEPERAHDLVSRQMIRVQRSEMLLRLIRSMHRAPRVERELWGIRFANPLGVAAGFDKNAKMVPVLAALGFGFVEIGTVTLRPQPGNPKPRMFRDPSSEALINRLGFNNEGAEAVARTLEKLRRNHAQLPPLFVNIGKNKDVPLDEAVDSYRACYRLLAPFADVIVVNVSSPNTPGLRDLQKSESLVEIIDALREEREKVMTKKQPIVVKIAPDLDEAAVDAIAELSAGRVDGLTATNTTLARDGWSAGEEAGGMSGRPLFRRSTEVLARLRQKLGAEFPLIGVGGIFDASDARAKFAAGADLIQGYTGFVYRGPSYASTIVRGLAQEAA